jgi:hypothetical protein
VRGPAEVEPGEQLSARVAAGRIPVTVGVTVGVTVEAAT